jgi:hypothetical protein
MGDRMLTASKLEIVYINIPRFVIAMWRVSDREERFGMAPRRRFGKGALHRVQDVRSSAPVCGLVGP